VSEQERLAFCFGPFQLDVAERLLLRNGESITLPPKAFETLLVLVQNSGRLITKRDLMNRLWPDTFVEEANLANNISLIRRVLDDDRQECKYIETVPKSGYRFVATVTEASVVTDTGPVVVPDVSSLNRVRGRWLAITLAATVLAVIGGYYLFRWGAASRTPAAPPTALKSLAVLPLRPLVETSRDEVLEMGVADTLITRLSRLRQINVRPMGAVRRYADVERDPVAIGRAQQVDAVLDGSIQKSDNKIRVSVRLVRVADAATLWVGQFDENYTDIFTLQDAISNRVAEVLITKLSGEEKEALYRRDTENVEAYHLYVNGRYFWSKFTEEGLQKSIDYYNQALEKDPNYAMAYVGLASSYVVLGVNYRPPKEMMPKAKAYVLKAMERDVALADAHITQGAIKYFFDWDWSGAESELRRAIDLGPSDAASAHDLYAYCLWTAGQFTEGIAELKRAQELDPLSLVMNEDLGVAYYHARNFDQAIEQQHKTLELDPNYFFGYLRRGQAYLQKGMFKEAIDDLTKAQNLSGNWPAAIAELSCAYALAGQKSKARRMLNDLNVRARREYIDPYLIALVHTTLGEHDAAFEWLGKAYESRSPWIGWLKAEPKFDPLRSDPRFGTFLRRVGLPE
jgi:DNA-binding winged helix-turn-helix (wHTH) protein/TolB-like protein/Flp pilus assembly protein TadD